MDNVGICLLVCICIIHVIPLVTLAWTTFNTSPYSILPRRLILTRRRERSLIFPNLNDLLRLNNPALRRFLGKYALAACSFHLLIITIFVLAMQYDVSLPFLPKLSTLLPEGVLDEYTKFSVVCGILQMLPIIALILVLYYNKRLPFMSGSTNESRMTKADLSSVEDLTENFGTIRLTRFEDSKKNVFFANCKDFRSGKLIKLALVQDKEEPERTECFRINRGLKTLVKLDPPPFYVDDLLKTFEAAKK